jgi:hypothetical protein
MLICAVTAFVMASAETFSYQFDSTPLPKAIQRIMEDHPDLDINFIYNELENYNTSAMVDADNAYEALRQTIGLNPVTVVRSKTTYYVEALQHGRYIYTGRTVGADNEPVAAATVMLLAPGDSTVLTYAIADKDGCFRIPCDQTDVIAKLSCVGYQTAFINCPTFALGTIVMKENAVKLSEVKVKGENVHLYSDRNVYLPTQRQKKTAMDAIDLLRRMAIPQINIKISDNIVETTDGRPVAIFIDYARASAEELKGLRTGDVQKVEFSYAPSDPRFMGELNVVNFILHQYKYGGYTKLMADERFFIGLSSDVSVYAKFKYKRMTYDLYAESRNTDNRHNGSSGTSSYLLSPDGETPYWVERKTTLTGSRMAENTLPVTLRASYDSKNFQMKNTVGFTFKEKPHDDNEGTIGFSPEIFNSSEYRTDKKSEVKTLSYYGTFNFMFPRQYNLSVYPSASYTLNDQRSRYTTSITNILNNAHEKVNDLNLYANLSKKLGENHYLYLSGFGGRTEYRVDYTGDSPAIDRLMSAFTGGTLKYGYYTNGFSADFQSGLRYQYNKTNGFIDKELYPFGSVNVGWSPNRRHSLNFHLNYSKETLPDNGKSPNVLKENELMYYRGNPDLNSSHMLSTSLSYSWNISSWLRISPYVRFLGLFDRWTPVYSAYDNGRAILRSYDNNGNHLWSITGVSATASFFNNSLQIQLMPTQDFYHANGSVPVTYNPFLFIGSIQYYLGNCYFSGYFNSPLTSLWSNYDTIIKTKSALEIEAGWSKSDLNVRFTVANPFRRSWEYSTTKAKYDYYTDNIVNYSNRAHFSLRLSATYTFGYGKKVKRGDEVSGAGTGSSAILK